MDFYYLKFIVQFCLTVGVINFVIGYPIVCWLSAKRKELLGWSQIFGAAIILILTGFTFYLGKFSYVKDYHLFFISIVTLITLLLIFKRKDRIKYIRTLVLNEAINVLITVAIMVVFLYPQKSLVPYIPSYGINHDAIGIISVAKLAFEKGDLPTFCVNQGNPLVCFLYNFNYPMGFGLYIAYFINFFNSIDYYNLAPILGLYLFSITAIPLKSLYRLFFKRTIFVNLIIFLSLIAYLPVQYVNQSSYGQVTLTFLLFSTLFIMAKLFDEKEYRWSLVMSLGLLLGASIYVYSFTIFFWLATFIVAIGIYKTLTKKIFISTVIKEFTIIALIMALFSGSYLMKSITLYKNMAFNYTKGADPSFFGAKGNSAGYANLTTAFSSWLETDFRIDYGGRPRTYAYLILFMQLSVVIYALIRINLIKKRNRWLFWITILTFVMPVIISAFILKSPYYYGKTLFYLSFVLSMMIYSSIFLVLTRKNKNIFVYIISVGMLVIVLNNSVKSLNWFGQPPLEKFKSINEAVGFLDNSKIENIIAVDNEDWLKYFLSGHGSCVTYSLANECGLENISFDKDNKMKLLQNHIYMIGKEYQGKIANNTLSKVLYENSYYKVVKY